MTYHTSYGNSVTINLGTPFSAPTNNPATSSPSAAASDADIGPFGANVGINMQHFSRDKRTPEEKKWWTWTVDLQRLNNTAQEPLNVARDSPQMKSTSPPPQTHGPSPSCAPNTKPVTALTSSMKMQLVATINFKRFLKVNSIKLKEPEDYFNWHTSLHVHAHMCGIYLPTLEEVEMYNIMVTG